MLSLCREIDPDGTGIIGGIDPSKMARIDEEIDTRARSLLDDS